MKTFQEVVFFVVLVAVLVAEIPTVRYCRPGDTRPGCTQCPGDNPWVECDTDPCEREAAFGCPLFKNNITICISNQCGGCNDQWYLVPEGRRVWCWGP